MNRCQLATLGCGRVSQVIWRCSSLKLNINKLCYAALRKNGRLSDQIMVNFAAFGAVALTRTLSREAGAMT